MTIETKNPKIAPEKVNHELETVENVKLAEKIDSTELANPKSLEEQKISKKALEQQVKDEMTANSVLKEINKPEKELTSREMVAEVKQAALGFHNRFDQMIKEEEDVYDYIKQYEKNIIEEHKINNDYAKNLKESHTRSQDCRDSLILIRELKKLANGLREVAQGYCDTVKNNQVDRQKTIYTQMSKLQIEAAKLIADMDQQALYETQVKYIRDGDEALGTIKKKKTIKRFLDKIMLYVMGSTIAVGVGKSIGAEKHSAEIPKDNLATVNVHTAEEIKNMGNEELKMEGDGEPDPDEEQKKEAPEPLTAEDITAYNKVFDKYDQAVSDKLKNIRNDYYDGKAPNISGNPDDSETEIMLSENEAYKIATVTPSNLVELDYSKGSIFFDEENIYKKYLAEETGGKVVQDALNHNRAALAQKISEGTEKLQAIQEAIEWTGGEIPNIIGNAQEVIDNWTPEKQEAWKKAMQKEKDSLRQQNETVEPTGRPTSIRRMSDKKFQKFLEEFGENMTPEELGQLLQEEINPPAPIAEEKQVKVPAPKKEFKPIKADELSEKLRNINPIEKAREVAMHLCSTAKNIQEDTEGAITLANRQLELDIAVHLLSLAKQKLIEQDQTINQENIEETMPHIVKKFNQDKETYHQKQEEIRQQTEAQKQAQIEKEQKNIAEQIANQTKQSKEKIDIIQRIQEPRLKAVAKKIQQTMNENFIVTEDVNEIRKVMQEIIDEPEKKLEQWRQGIKQEKIKMYYGTLLKRPDVEKLTSNADNQALLKKVEQKMHGLNVSIRDVDDPKEDEKIRSIINKVYEDKYESDENRLKKQKVMREMEKKRLFVIIHDIKNEIAKAKEFDAQAKKIEEQFEQQDKNWRKNKTSEEVTQLVKKVMQENQTIKSEIVEENRQKAEQIAQKFESGKFFKSIPQEYHDPLNKELRKEMGIPEDDWAKMSPKEKEQQIQKLIGVKDVVQIAEKVIAETQKEQGDLRNWREAFKEAFKIAYKKEIAKLDKIAQRLDIKISDEDPAFKKAIDDAEMDALKKANEKSGFEITDKHEEVMHKAVQDSIKEAGTIKKIIKEMRKGD